MFFAMGRKIDEKIEPLTEAYPGEQSTLHLLRLWDLY